MASIFPTGAEAQRAVLTGGLADKAYAIASPRFDALFFWGAPLLAVLLVWAWAGAAMLLPPPAGEAAIGFLISGVAILTFAHLIAVAPRAYLNADVFADHRARLVWVPILLVAALLVSPALLILGGILAVLWDVHHSAMQTFGLSRIYDMKAGADPHVLRKTDLRLSWALYVGPIAAGASLIHHFTKFGELGALDWRLLAELPGVLQAYSAPISYAAIAAWAGTLLWAAADYRKAIRQEYRMPVHKAALLGSTAATSIAAWGFAPPILAFTMINLFHAVQYFALVWLKEGDRVHRRLALPPRAKWGSLLLFLLLCGGFGVAYYEAQDAKWLLAPFIACSLLHFWFDSFVWSVRKKQV